MTNKACGEGRNIIDDLLVLNLYSPTVPNLTIIDLPSIANAALSGQSSDMLQITYKIAERYVQDLRAIILAVNSATLPLTRG